MNFFFFLHPEWCWLSLFGATHLLWGDKKQYGPTSCDCRGQTVRPYMFVRGWHIWHWKLIICVCFCLFHVPAGIHIYFCASNWMYLHSKYLRLCILVLFDVRVNVPTHPQPWKFERAYVCTFVPGACLACCERWRRFCSSDTATVSCRHIQSRRNHYTIFSVIN